MVPQSESPKSCFGFLTGPFPAWSFYILHVSARAHSENSGFLPPIGVNVSVNGCLYMSKVYTAGAPFSLVGRAHVPCAEALQLTQVRPPAWSLCCVSFPLSLPRFPVMSSAVLSIKPQKANNKKKKSVHSCTHNDCWDFLHSPCNPAQDEKLQIMDGNNILHRLTPQTIQIGSHTTSTLVLIIGDPPGLCAQPQPVHTVHPRPHSHTSANSKGEFTLGGNKQSS